MERDSKIYAAMVAGLAGAYYGAAKLGLSLAFETGSARFRFRDLEATVRDPRRARRPPVITLVDITPPPPWLLGRSSPLAVSPVAVAEGYIEAPGLAGGGVLADRVRVLRDVLYRCLD